MIIHPKKHRLAVFFLVIFVSFVMFTNVAVPKAYAQWAVLDPANLGQNIWQGVKWVYDKYMKQAIALAFKEGLKMILSQIAYDTATQIATGGRGQKSSFWNQNWGDYLGNVGDAVLGQVMDDLAKDWGQFDICNPSSVNIKLGINLSLFKERKPSQFGLNARCKFSEISKSWQTWANEVRNDPSKLYGDLRDSFKPAENDAGMYLTLHSTLLRKEEDSKLNAIIERSVNKGIKDVASPIVRSIKTPALLLGEKFASVDKETGKVEYTYTGEIVDSLLGTFTNTLMAKWMDQLFNKGFNTAQELDTQLGLGASGQPTGRTASAAGDTFAALAAVNFTTSRENILDLLSLPCTNPKENSPAGPTCEVVNSNFITAVKAKMTLREAMETTPALIDGSKPVGFLSNASEPGYQNGYPYRSLVILRTQRIIPVGWELAAMYFKLYGGTHDINFDYLTFCFEDPADPDNPRKPSACREDTNGNNMAPADEDQAGNLPDNFVYDINPYYHLVDPNWVLKSPETFCNRQGPGPEVTYDELQCMVDNVPGTAITGHTIEENDGAYAMSGPYCESSLPGINNNPDVPVRMVTRNLDYCGDWQSCILEAADGSCQAYGYCVKEKPVWRFEGEACPDYYNSCETFYDSRGSEYSYLRDTLLACEQNEAGCAWYSVASAPTSSRELVWSPEERIYLNQDAKSCTYSNAGCTKLSSLKPGLNAVFNGNFSENNAALGNALPLGWEVNDTVAAVCNFIYNVPGGEMRIEATDWHSARNTHCQLQSQGLIPIDSNFTYQFSYKISADQENVWAGVGLTFYDANGVLCDAQHPAPCSVNLGQELFGDVFRVPQTATYYSFEIGPESADNYGFLAGAKYVKAVVKGPHHHDNGGAMGPIRVDDIQLTIIKSPVVKHNAEGFTADPQAYAVDYSQSGNFAAYLKVPPAHLNCEAYNNLLYSYSTQTACENAGRLWRTDIGAGVCVAGGSLYCSNYTNFCPAKDVGCNGYTPINGGPEIPAKITAADACPAECSGYNSFLQQITYFDEIEEDPDPDPAYRNFIPATGNVCQANYAGCEQFTNMDEVAKGGEGIEYFTYLRQCISAGNPDISSYYTWEGSDTTGYQLKKWTLLGSNQNNAPCTHTILNQEGCQDTAQNLLQYECDYPSSDLNCRDFFNASGEHFALDQRYLIIASGQCHPYRRTQTGQIFNADPLEGIACPAAANNCKEYKGNAGNNIREAAFLDFENTGGTPGGVTQTNGSTGGLVLSNETLYQGGHSLRVYVNNDTIVYPLPGELTGAKQYQLSFWAKKVYIGGIKTSGGFISKNFVNRLAGLFGQRARAQNGGNNSLEFIQDNLTDNWQLYTLGPVELNAQAAASRLAVTVSNLGATDGYFIDNIRLVEYAENFYLIEDFWQTPVACDQPYVGAQLGCAAYRDTDAAANYLKSFDYICSPASIGCEAFINTQNSTDAQAEKTWFGTCDGDIGEIGENACGNPAIPGNGRCCTIRGMEMCNVADGQASCEYENVTVPNDQIIYVVNNPNKYCGASEKGCAMVGWPELNRQYDYYTGEDLDVYYGNYIKGFTASYIINDPDKYSSQLCSAGGLYCEAFTGDPELTALAYFYNPLAAQAGQGGLANNSARTCFYDSRSGAWLKTGTLEACSLAKFMPASADPNYQGWVGLCDAGNSTCTEYRDPQQPLSAKVEECDAGISPQLAAICDPLNGDSYEIVNGKMYCQKEINGITQNVCTLYKPNPNPLEPPLLCTDANNCTPCPYTEHDWICALDHIACAGQANGCAGEYCYIAGGPAPKPVCYVTKGQQVCNYSLACESYYYLHNSVKQCQGVIDNEAGCMLFNDTSNPELNYSSDITADGQPPQRPTNCSPAFYHDDQALADCDSNTPSGIKVRKDRECAESLFCTSSVEITDANNQSSQVCLSVGRCAQLNPTNTSKCLNIVNSIETDEQTYTFHDNNYIPTGVEEIRNLSGFSKAGLIWYNDDDDDDKDKIIRGNYPPEQMSQLGEEKEIVNAGFESFDADGVKNWEESSADNAIGQSDNCRLVQTNSDPYSGTYSLGVNVKSSLDTSNYYCRARTTGLYRLDASQDYIFSFFARSQSGAQRLTAVFQFFDGGGEFMSGGYTRVVINKLAPTNWTYYSGIIGPAGQNIPEAAEYFKVSFGPAREASYAAGDQPGTIWFDEVKVAPALEIAQDLRAVKECRLYPADNAPACEYTASQVYRGWYGYCLEHDPDNSEACIQWFPIDSVAGESLNVLGQSAAGYNGPAPLYYCLQAEGNSPYILEANKRSQFYCTCGDVDADDIYGEGDCFDIFDIIYDISGLLYNKRENDDPCNDGKPRYVIGGCGEQAMDRGRYIAIDNTFAESGLMDNDIVKIVASAARETNQGPAEIIITPDDKFNGDICASFANQPGNNSSDWFNFEICQHLNELGENWTVWSKLARGANNNWLGLAVYFDSSHELQRYFWKIWDDSGENDEADMYNITYYLRETCAYVVQAVKEPDQPGSLEKAWFTRWDSGWNSSAGNVMGYNLNMPSYPYGAAITPAEGEPDSWLNSGNTITIPYNIYRGTPQSPQIDVYPSGGTPLSIPTGRSAADPICVGGGNESKECLSSSDCVSDEISGNGICMGVGKYCYNAAGMTNGTACRDNAGCGGDYSICRAPNLEEASPQSALTNRLLNLFAQVWGVWEWNGNAYLPVKDLDLSVVGQQGQAPVINNILLNNKAVNLILTAPGNSVELSFTTDVNDDQLPIDTITIKWNDGPDDEQTMDVSMYDKPSPNNPHKIFHTYSCVTNSEGNACVFCWNESSGASGEWEESTDGSCRYAGPFITVQDHWEFCPSGFPGEGNICEVKDGSQFQGDIYINPAY